MTFLSSTDSTWTCVQSSLTLTRAFITLRLNGNLGSFPGQNSVVKCLVPQTQRLLQGVHCATLFTMIGDNWALKSAQTLETMLCTLPQVPLKHWLNVLIGYIFQSLKIFSVEPCLL